MREIEIHANKRGEVYFWYCDMHLAGFLRSLTAEDTQSVYETYLKSPELFEGVNTLEDELIERTQVTVQALIERGMVVYRDEFWRGNFGKIVRELVGLPV